YESLYDTLRHAISIVPPQDQCIVFDTYLNAQRYNNAIAISPVLQSSYLPAHLIEQAAYSPKQALETMNTYLPQLQQLNVQIEHLKVAMTLCFNHQQELSAYE